MEGPGGRRPSKIVKVNVWNHIQDLCFLATESVPSFLWIVKRWEFVWPEVEAIKACKALQGQREESPNLGMAIV